VWTHDLQRFARALKDEDEILMLLAAIAPVLFQGELR
jgi:hypothetical protein